MASDRFEIAIDPERRLLRVTMRGLWDLDTIEDYRRAALAAASSMIASGCSSGAILALVDVRDGGAQQQDVVVAFRERMGGGDLAPRRLATLVTSALLKRQVERIAVPNQRLFTDESEAMAWLLDNSEPER